MRSGPLFLHFFRSVGNKLISTRCVVTADTCWVAGCAPVGFMVASINSCGTVFVLMVVPIDNTGNATADESLPITPHGLSWYRRLLLIRDGAAISPSAVTAWEGPPKLRPRSLDELLILHCY